MMPVMTMLAGALLTAIGVSGYVVTEMVSWTALIPAFLGLPLLVLGALSFNETRRKHTMHAAAALGALGFLAFTGRGVPSWLVYFGLVNGEVKSVPATLSTLSSAVVCLVFVALCVNSFIQARRRRQAEAPAGVAETNAMR